MNVRIESVKFDADQKLLDFVEKKVSKLDKFFDSITGAVVTLSLVPGYENKKVSIRLNIPGSDLLVDRTAESFEEATAACVEVLKENVKKTKEKKRNV